VETVTLQLCRPLHSSPQWQKPEPSSRDGNLPVMPVLPSCPAGCPARLHDEFALADSTRVRARPACRHPSESAANSTTSPGRVRTTSRALDLPAHASPTLRYPRPAGFLRNCDARRELSLAVALLALESYP
jgi:hypothetical protein